MHQSKELCQTYMDTAMEARQLKHIDMFRRWHKRCLLQFTCSAVHEVPQVKLHPLSLCAACTGATEFLADAIEIFVAVGHISLREEGRIPCCQCYKSGCLQCSRQRSDLIGRIVAIIATSRSRKLLWRHGWDYYSHARWDMLEYNNTRRHHALDSKQKVVWEGDPSSQVG